MAADFDAEVPGPIIAVPTIPIVSVTELDKTRFQPGYYQVIFELPDPNDALGAVQFCYMVTVTQAEDPTTLKVPFGQALASFFRVGT